MTERKSWFCATEEDTCILARRIAAWAKKGDTFALKGTLGMGKSVFARAFIMALADVKEVPSPTFTLVQEYDAPNFTIFHYDLYRLKSPEEIFELGMEDAVYGGVCLIEWPERMENYLPRKTIEISFVAENGGRKIVLSTQNENLQNRLEKL